MFPKRGLILAAVSGGADSMCLLTVLKELRTEMGYDLGAVHFNHMLRGAGSDSDEEFVKKYCAEINIPLFCGRGDTGRFARSEKIGTEEAARILRYRFFEETAAKTGALRVATAHTADDNAETMVMNLARGSGLKGLCGIPPVRGMYIRPMLTVTREEVESYLGLHGIGYVTDKSNETDEYTRNRVRHHIIPLLKDLNGNLLSNISEAAQLLGDDEDYLSKQALKFISESFRGNAADRNELLNLHKAVFSRVIRHFCPGADREHIEMVQKLCDDSASPSARCDLPGISVMRRNDDVVFGTAEIEKWEPFNIKPGEEAIIKQLGISVRCRSRNEMENFRKSFTSFLFNSSDICGKISVRLRKPGDSIRLSAGSGTKTLKKLFIEKKIPAAERDMIPVISDDEKVLAVYGLGQDHRYLDRKVGEWIEIEFSKTV